MNNEGQISVEKLIADSGPTIHMIDITQDKQTWPPIGEVVLIHTQDDEYYFDKVARIVHEHGKTTGVFSPDYSDSPLTPHSQPDTLLRAVAWGALKKDWATDE